MFPHLFKTKNLYDCSTAHSSMNSKNEKYPPLVKLSKCKTVCIIVKIIKLIKNNWEELKHEYE